MTCSCPKCHAQIEVDLSGISENGTLSTCPECKNRFWINRESYARMALKKEGQTYCDKCGNELDHSIVCAECGVMYPDYYLVQSSKPPRRQVEKPDLFSISFSLKPATKQTYVYTGARRSVTAPSKAIFAKICAVAIVVLLTIGAGYFYDIRKTEQQYAINYMRALYSIKVGTDLSLSACTKISTEWKTSLDAGQKYAPHISAEEESRLNQIKDTTDGFMQTLNETPDKFTVSKEKLATLYGIFIKSHDLAIAPSGALSSFTNSANKSQNDYNAAVRELKANMPPELSSEFQIAKAKYRALKDI